MTAMLTGGNKNNQHFIIDGKFPEIINEALRTNEVKSFRTPQ